MRRWVAVVLPCLLCASSVSAAKIYRWMDEGGKVHYGDRPGQSSAQKVEIDSHNKTSPNPSGKQRIQKQKRLLKAFEIERQRKQEDQQKKRDKQRKLAQKCAKARKQLRDIRDAHYLYQKGEDEKRNILTDTQRQVATRELKDAIAKHCD